MKYCKGQLLIKGCMLLIALSFFSVSFNQVANSREKNDQIEILIQKLKDENAFIRIDAIDQLGQMKDKRAVPFLIEALKDESPDVRGAAARALAEIKDTRVLEPLIEVLLKNNNEGVSFEAVQALVRTKDARAVVVLKKATGYSSAAARWWAAYALGEIEDDKAKRFLHDALVKKNLEIVAGAHRFFIRRGKPDTEIILIESLNQYDNITMAKSFFFYGNSILADAVQQWKKIKIMFKGD